MNPKKNLDEYVINELIVLSRAAPQISKAHLHETKGFDEGQTAVDNHKCNGIS